MRKSTAFVLVALALLLGAVWAFGTELRALAWHVRHGLHATGAGLRVRLPLLYSAMEGEGSLVLMQENGRARRRFSGEQGVLVFISKNVPNLKNTNETVDEWWKRYSAVLVRQGARQTASRPLTIAGRSERCYQFEGGDFIVGTDVWCVPDSGGWIADYTGPSAHVQQFYAVLESAQAP